MLVVKRLCVSVLFLVVFTFDYVAAQVEEVSLSDFEELQSQVVSVSQRCMPASVGVGSKEILENGSGVVVSGDGLVLTAYHVIEDLPDDGIIVSFVDGTTAMAKKLGGIPQRDIAMVQIVDEGQYPFVGVGDMNDVAEGDWCVSISHAGGFQHDRTPPVRLGRIACKNDPKEGFLQITASLIGGDSGGPTFDLSGNVIGIHSNLGDDLMGNNAAPISDFTQKDHWQRMLKGEVWGDGEFGEKLAGFWERRLQELIDGNSHSQSQIGKRDYQAIPVQAFKDYAHKHQDSVVRFWRRGKAICLGVILTNDGVIVTKSSELVTPNFEIELPSGELVKGRILKRVKEEDMMFVRVERDFKTALLNCKFADKVEYESEGLASEIPLGSIVVAVGFLGDPIGVGVKSVDVRDMAKDGHGLLGVSLRDDLSIKRVTPNGAAQKAGLRRGDKLTKIGQDEVNSIEQLRELLRALEPNTRIPVEFERDGRVAASLVKLGSSNTNEDVRNEMLEDLNRKRKQFTNALQTDVDFEPNQAGSILLDLSGQVIGINIARAGRVKSYALPMETISREFNLLLQQVNAETE